MTPTVAITNASGTARPISPATAVPLSAIAAVGVMIASERAIASTNFSSRRSPCRCSGDAVSVVMAQEATRVVDIRPAMNDVDRRAGETKRQMPDDERFSLLISGMGTNELVRERDARIPEGVPMSAGYVPGVSRLRGPAQDARAALLGAIGSLLVVRPGSIRLERLRPVLAWDAARRQVLARPGRPGQWVRSKGRRRVRRRCAAAIPGTWAGTRCRRR